MKVPRPLKEVEPIALGIYQALKPHCQFIKLAGSIRRRKPLVGDVEVVCVPQLIQVSVPVPRQIDLFNGTWTEPTVELRMVRSPEFADAVKKLGYIQAGAKIERAVKIIVEDDIQLDLFITTAADFGRQLAIRTGPWEYSQNVVATGWVRKGWVGTEDGLRRRKQCEQKGGKWICKASNPDVPPPFHSEEDFFDFINTRYIEPKFRK